MEEESSQAGGKRSRPRACTVPDTEIAPKPTNVKNALNRAIQLSLLEAAQTAAKAKEEEPPLCQSTLPCPAAPDQNDTELDSLVFTLSLFRMPGGAESTFVYYKDCCGDFLRYMSGHWGPQTQFVIHIDDTIPDSALLELNSEASMGSRLWTAGKGAGRPGAKKKQEGAMHEAPQIHYVRYSMIGSKKSGSCWLVNTMRYRTLWEWPGKETVVTMDVHDDHGKQCALIKRLVTKMKGRQEAGKSAKESGSAAAISLLPALPVLPVLPAEVAHTYWRCNHRDCPHGASLPVRCKGDVHCHTDGGLCVWRHGMARLTIQTEMKKHLQFIDHVQNVVEYARSIPRGVDEMLVDAFLTHSSILDSPLCLFELHKHKIKPQAQGQAAAASNDDEEESTTVPDSCKGAGGRKGEASKSALGGRGTVPVDHVVCELKIETVYLDCGTARSSSAGGGERNITVCSEKNDEVATWNKQMGKYREEHNSECHVCDDGGNVLCCDGCNLVFHESCLRPVVCGESSITLDDYTDWFCPYCTVEPLMKHTVTAEQRASAQAGIVEMEALSSLKKSQDVAGAAAVQHAETVAAAITVAPPAPPAPPTVKKRRVVGCHKCGKEGHYAKTCSAPTKITDADAFSDESLAPDVAGAAAVQHAETAAATIITVPSSTQSQHLAAVAAPPAAKKRRVVRCHKCGKEGHYAKTCIAPTNDEDMYSDDSLFLDNY